MTFPDVTLNDRVAIVTGASSGIGRAIAIGMAKAGATVVATGRRPEAVQQTVDSITALGGTAISFTFDLADLVAGAAAIDRVVERLGTVDILVNNAADTNRANVLISAFDVQPENWDTVFDVGIRGLFFFTQAAGRVMRNQGRGRIVNIGSSLGLRALPNRVIYGTVKGAVIQLTRMLAVEWAPYGINVNCICPSFTRTDIIAERLKDPQYRKAAIGSIPLGRLAEPEEIAAAAVFLASPAADFISGHILSVDGAGEAAL